MSTRRNATSPAGVNGAQCAPIVITMLQLAYTETGDEHI
jgi:hypothetical protein